MLLFNHRPDLVSTEDEDANASHPSEHNIEFGDPNSQKARSALSSRAVKAQRMLSRAKQACTSPKRDAWVQLQAERNSTQRGHKEAFTDPMQGAAPYYPYWGIAMFPAFGSVAWCLIRRSVDSPGSLAGSTGDISMMGPLTTLVLHAMVVLTVPGAVTRQEWAPCKALRAESETEVAGWPVVVVPVSPVESPVEVVEVGVVGIGAAEVVAEATALPVAAEGMQAGAVEVGGAMGVVAESDDSVWVVGPLKLFN